MTSVQTNDKKSPIARAKSWLADLAGKAQSSADHSQVVGELERQIADAQRELASLEAERETVALQGNEAIDDHTRRLGEAEQRSKTLGAALAAAKRRQADAEVAEKTAEIEAKAAEAANLEADAAETWAVLRALTEQVQAACERIAEIEHQYADLTYGAERAARKDLIIPKAVRGKWRQALARSLPTPELGPDVVGIPNAMDTIGVSALLAVEKLLATAVHEDAFAARRTFVLCSIIPEQRPGGGQIVVPFSSRGRAIGGIGRGIAAAGPQYWELAEAKQAVNRRRMGTPDRWR